MKTEELTRTSVRGSRIKPKYVYVLILCCCLCRQTDPIEFVENICENMQLFPKEDFLTGDLLMFHFDPQVTEAAGPRSHPESTRVLRII